MDDKYKSSIFGKGLESEINKPIPPNIGEKIPDIELHDIEGKVFKLSDFLGKYMLLDFWSMACYPWVLAAPELRELKNTFNDSLTIVGLSMDVDPKMWAQATKRDSVTWINLSDGMGNFAGVSSKFGIEGMPTYFLINPSGTIIDKWVGYEEGIFKEKINSHLSFKNK
jgi:peroxiredoxin